MREEAQNALLKLVEEPPAHCVLILITPNPDTILPTIRSRCQRVRFSPLARRASSRRSSSSTTACRADAAGVAASLSRGRHPTGKGARRRLRRRGEAVGLRSRRQHRPTRRTRGWSRGRVTISRSTNRDSAARFLDDLAVAYPRRDGGRPRALRQPGQGEDPQGAESPGGTGRTFPGFWTGSSGPATGSSGGTSISKRPWSISSLISSTSGDRIGRRFGPVPARVARGTFFAAASRPGSIEIEPIAAARHTLRDRGRGRPGKGERTRENVLRHNGDRLRQRPPAPRHRVREDRRGLPGPLQEARRLRHVLPHGDRRAQHQRGEGSAPPRARRRKPTRPRWPASSRRCGRSSTSRTTSSSGPTSTSTSGRSSAPLRDHPQERLHLSGHVRGVLLRVLRGVRAGEGPRGRRALPETQREGAVARGEELFLRALEVQRRAEEAHRSAPRVHPAGDPPERDPRT